MKIISKDTAIHILRFDKGEDVIDGLVKYCGKNNLAAAHFTGLGACGSMILSYYDLDNKKYLDKTFDEDLEIVSLTGNVAKLKDQTIIHTHGVFSAKTYETFGGHVKAMIVSATCEIHLTVIPGTLKRGFDSDSGLNLLQ